MTDDDAAETPDDDAWSGDRVANWLRLSAGIERQLAPVSEVLFAGAALQPGERVLDVGCGTGPTTRDAAAAVGAEGAVTGLDVSSEMLDAAATVAAPDGSAPIAWEVADAVSWDAPEGAFDVVVSRFGVMFFSDPAAAFAALARATRPGGRLAIAVWGRRDESSLFAIPLRAVLAVREAHGLEALEGIPDDGGPFSLHDADATTALLEGAGWSDVTVTPHALDLPFGGGLPPAEAAEVAAGFGPTRVALDGVSDQVRADAVAALTEVLAPHVDDDGHVLLGGSVRVVTASR